MATVRDLIAMSLRKLGVVGSGEDLKASELNDGLAALRLMVDAWALEPLLIPVITTITKPLIVGEIMYTIGAYPSGSPPDNHIETAIPIEYLAGFIRDGGGTDTQLTQINTQEYSLISVKSNGARATEYYIQDGWPLSKLILNSEPYANDTMHLSVKQNLSQLLPLTSLNDVLSLPEGIEYALMYNLCLQIASEYGQNVTQAIAYEASNSKRNIKDRYAKPLISRVDPALTYNRRATGTYNIYQGP